MSSNLTKTDYIKILTLYNIRIPKTITLIKHAADKILSNKLCRCIKKISPTQKGKSVGICSRSIFNKRGLTRGKFKCATTRYVKYSKKNKTQKNKTKH